jgi:arginine-tRNA-protein transferase
MMVPASHRCSSVIARNVTDDFERHTFAIYNALRMTDFEPLMSHMHIFTMATSSEDDESSTGTELAKNNNSVRLYGSALVECGYCKGNRAAHVNKETNASSKAYSILADSLEAALYEDFLYAGWRRSGNALYQPDNWESCCPALTIRMAVEHFAPTKSQKKVARQMKRLLEGPKTALSSSASSVASLSSQHKQRQQTRVAQSRRSRQEQMVQESGMLDTLQEWTQALLLDVLQQQPAPLPQKLPSVSFKLQPPRKTNKSDNTSNDAILLVTVYTTVCAAIAGQSRGSIDRTDLSERLAQALLQKSSTGGAEATAAVDGDSEQGTTTATDNTATNNGAVESHHKKHRIATEPLPAATATNTTDTATSAGVTIHSVQAHPKSGQVLVELHVPAAADDHSTAMDTDTTTDDTSRADRLKEWLLSVRKTEQPLPQAPYNLTVETLPAHESVLDPDVHQLYFLYQHKVHDDPYPYDTPTNSDKDKDDDRDRGSPFDSKWAGHAPVGWLESARAMLKREYHHLPASQLERIAKSYQSFYEFLVENPFVATGENESSANSKSKPPPPGTYHQHYRLADGVLIAVGVVDVLPHGLSSVYLFYDPTFAHDLVPLGKYAILREIEWTQQVGLPYYYLGYYIESCPKMRYKADYHPSELLCPTTHQWVNAEEAKKTLLRESPQRHCCTLYKNEGSSTGTGPPPGGGVDNTASIVQQVRMEVGIDTPVTIRVLQSQGQELVKPYLEEFVKKAGREISLKCVVNFR